MPLRKIPGRSRQAELWSHHSSSIRWGIDRQRQEFKRTHDLELAVRHFDYASDRSAQNGCRRGLEKDCRRPKHTYLPSPPALQRHQLRISVAISNFLKDAFQKPYDEPLDEGYCFCLSSAGKGIHRDRWKYEGEGQRWAKSDCDQMIKDQRYLLSIIEMIVPFPPFGRKLVHVPRVPKVFPSWFFHPAVCCLSICIVVCPGRHRYLICTAVMHDFLHLTDQAIAPNSS